MMMALDVALVASSMYCVFVYGDSFGSTLQEVYAKSHYLSYFSLQVYFVHFNSFPNGSLWVALFTLESDSQR